MITPAIADGEPTPETHSFLRTYGRRNLRSNATCRNGSPPRLLPNSSLYRFGCSLTRFNGLEASRTSVAVSSAHPAFGLAASSGLWSEPPEATALSSPLLRCISEAASRRTRSTWCSGARATTPISCDFVNFPLSDSKMSSVPFL